MLRSKRAWSGFRSDKLAPCSQGNAALRWSRFALAGSQPLGRVCDGKRKCAGRRLPLCGRDPFAGAQWVGGGLPAPGGGGGGGGGRRSGRRADEPLLEGRPAVGSSFRVAFRLE